MSTVSRQTGDVIQPWDSDHTALVHVLWEARRKGLTLESPDELASLIMRSKWLHAVRLHAYQFDPDGSISGTCPVENAREHGELRPK